MITNPHTGKEEELIIEEEDWIVTEDGMFAVKHLVYSSLHIYTIGMDGEGNPYIVSYRNKDEDDLL